MLEIGQGALKIILLHANLASQKIGRRESWIGVNRALHCLGGVDSQLGRRAVKNHGFEMGEVEICFWISQTLFDSEPRFLQIPRDVIQKSEALARSVHTRI